MRLSTFRRGSGLSSLEFPKLLRPHDLLVGLVVVNKACAAACNGADGCALLASSQGSDGAGAGEDGLKVGGGYTVPVAREKAYALLQDPTVLAKCMPGTDELKQIGDDEYEMKMKMAIADISGLFTGREKIAETHPPEHFRLLVDGTGKIGFVKGEGLLTLAEAGEGSTEVSCEGDVQVGGAMAGVGQQLLDTKSKMIIKKFFEKFSEIAKG